MLTAWVTYITKFISARLRLSTCPSCLQCQCVFTFSTVRVKLASVVNRLMACIRLGLNLSRLSGFLWVGRFSGIWHLEPISVELSSLYFSEARSELISEWAELVRRQLMLFWSGSWWSLRHVFWKQDDFDVMSLTSGRKSLLEVWQNCHHAVTWLHTRLASVPVWGWAW